MTHDPTPEAKSPVPISIRRSSADSDSFAQAAVDGVVVAALGDLMLSGEWEVAAARGGLAAGLEDLGELVAADDLVFANLETTSPGDEGVIEKEPRVVAAVELIEQSLRTLGVDLVNLANNHAFDAHASGFERVRRMLDDAGVQHLGAGNDAAEAAASRTLRRRGVRFGWLAYCDRGTRPSHVAAENTAGVNSLDAERALAEVAELAPRVDHAIVSIHWGVEYCHIPSPEQIEVARSLVDAGARLVIGHHAHVVQGNESRGDGAIVYNLGNVTTTDHHVGGRLAIRQTERTRSSFVLRAAFGKDRLLALEAVPIRSEPGRVLVADAVAGEILERAQERLDRGVTPELWRRTRLYEDVVLRTVRKLDPRVIGSLRPRHLLTFGKNLVGAMKGRGPSA